MNPRLPKQRRGFTLIELLIVIAVIGLLMSILGVAVMRSLGVAKISATKALMIKVQRQLQTRIEALQRSDIYRSQRDFQGGAFLEGAAVDAAARRGGSTPISRVPHVKKVLAHKVLQRQFFPQTWAEASYLLERVGKTAPLAANINPFNESAEVLYFFLTDSSIVGYTPANQDVFGGNEVRDTDNNGFPELVDAWGRPVRFYRWPSRLLRPAGYTGLVGVTQADYDIASVLISGIPTNVTAVPTLQNSASLNHDPDDNLNVTLPGYGGWLAMGNAEAAAVESGTAPFVGSPFPLHTVFTWHTPLVVSAGPDGDFGIYDPTDPAHIGRLCEPILVSTTPDVPSPALFDNVSNLNVKSGGK